ncbi:DegV family protein [Bacillus sp. CGMCC 1.16607]|uniref:DegV family protein n=1 Tax=Bacillus sp. CGMCC 1.16607 TaxID=3351842 RepID=UPI0036286F85
MAKIKIVTDSTADLTEEQIKEYNIEVVPLMITIDGQSFTDRVDITPIEFLEKMGQANELPKTSQPSTGVFLELYDRLSKEGYEILSIHMTGGMSGTVRSAESAAQMTEGKVTVVDSRYISKALSFQVLEAAEQVAQGKSVSEIVKHLEHVQKQSRLYIMVDTLENLVKGGRIGKGKAFIGSLLNIKPIASLEGGEYTPVSKVRSHSQVVKHLIKQFSEDVKGTTVKRVGLAHAEAQELAAKLKKEIEDLTGFKKIEIDYTTPVISTHTGKGAIALMYYFD